MTTKLIRFSFYKSPGPEGLRLRETHSIQSTPALAGMETVFQNLHKINAEAYGKVRTLEEFTVTLTPLTGSENFGLQIRSKKLQINIGKLKPETRAQFFASIEPQPLSKNISSSNPALSLGPDTMASMSTPSSFLKDLLVPWTMIVSKFREWVNSFLNLIPKNSASSKPDILENSSEKEASSETKVLSLSVEPASTEVFYDLETAQESRGILDIADPKKTARIQRRLEKAKKLTAKQAPLPQPVALPSSPPAALTKSNLPPEGYAKLIPLPDEKPLAKRDRSILLESIPSEIKTVDSKQARSTIAPAIQSDPVDDAKEDGDFVALKAAGTQPSADPIQSVKAINPAEITLRSLFLALFSAVVQSTSSKQVFGVYLLEQVFPPVQSCEMDPMTGRFKLTFAQEKQIPLATLPSGKSDETLKKLRPAKGTTLHIAKELTGRINVDDNQLEFDEGSLTIQWKTWGVPFTAHLLNIQTHPQDPKLLLFKGKLGITGIQAIPAQDFVDFLECNITEAKRKGLLG